MIVPPVIPDFESMVLLQRVWQFQHALHGTLTITRRPKQASTKQIDFDVDLLEPNQNQLHDVCHVVVDNYDDHVTPHVAPHAHRMQSSVAYGDIDISNMGNRRIIYPVHVVMAGTGIDLGVRCFVVCSIVNDKMDGICTNCGMVYGHQGSDYQGTCFTVQAQATMMANNYGWF